MMRSHSKPYILQFVLLFFFNLGKDIWLNISCPLNILENANGGKAKSPKHHY